MAETRRQRCNKTMAALISERASHLAHWKQIGEALCPWRLQFTTTDTNRGERRNYKIIDETGTYAARTMEAGMMGGMTSPARPWFKVSTHDPALAEVEAVKEWLHVVGQRLSDIFLRSNLYNALPIVYGDIGTFGTAAMIVEEDFNDAIRCYTYPIGTYALATNDRMNVDVFFREFRLTVRQLVQKFGQRDNSGKIIWDNFSPQIKNYYELNQHDIWIDVCHVIQPNPDYNPVAFASKKYESVYYERNTIGQTESANDDGVYLRESGYDYFPVLAPRWQVRGEDVYGTVCPGMIALGGINQLQLGEKRIMQAVEKMINPPMVAPPSMIGKRMSILPGDTTFAEEREGMKGIRPVHEVRFDIQPMEMKQEQVRQRIRKAFYEDLFLMFANMERNDITATEINARREEKLLVLGPVLEQLNQDLLDPLIDITFDIMVKQRLIPMPPPELQGAELKVEYISIMHQAQKTAGLAGIERLASFAAQTAQFDPTVIDRIDTDQMIEEYATVTGVAPRIIRSDDAVAQIRDSRAKAQQAAQQAEALKSGAGAAKDLSQTNLDGNSALKAMLDMSHAGQMTPQ